MATRRETEQRRERLKKAVRDSCLDHTLKPGALAPPVRELAEQYQLSVNLVCQALQELVEEGYLHTVPRVGTFVGRPQTATSEFYLMLLPDNPGITDSRTMQQIQTGFEGRIAQRGGASLVMPLQSALKWRRQGELPRLNGVFDFAYHPDDPATWGVDAEGGSGADSIPRVGFSGRIEPASNADAVSYDDIDGGRQATQHLWRLGHRRIAFLGVHCPDAEPGELVWSEEREIGWRDVLESGGIQAAELAFHPAAMPEHESRCHTQVGRDLALRILRRPDITAVVAANDFAAMGLFEAARAAQIPPERWPSVVGFDNLPTANGHIMTSLRYSGEDVGSAAADLLWERKHGLLAGPPQHRRAKMHLIPRLTSRMDWSLQAGHAALAAPLP